MVNLTHIYKNGIVADDDSRDYEDLDPRQAFLAQIRSHGMKPPPFMAQDTITRFQDKDDKPQEKTAWAWYTLIEGDILIGRFGTWRGNPECVDWCSRKIESMTTAERTLLHEAAKRGQEAKEKEAKKIQENVASDCERLLSQCKQAVGHPYIKKKGIKEYGLKVYNGRLLIPIYINESLSSVQFIDEDGQKRFKTGGAIKSGYYRFNGGESIVYICEGFATGATVFEETGMTTYCAFSAGNLFNVTLYAREKHPDAKLIVAADNDAQKEPNTGLMAAMQVTNSMVGVDCVYPEFKVAGEGKDFNDYRAIYGADATSRLLIRKPIKTDQQDDTTKPTDAKIPHGALGNIVTYYKATSGNDQHGFAIQTALAIGSFVCGRYFCTNEDNYAALYLLNVGRTATGKEHCKATIEKILKASGQGHLISGDGFTSAGAVMSCLLQKPRTISVIDEFGMYLKASKMAGSSNQHEANSVLMQAISRCASTLRAKSYSSITLTKKQAEELQSKEVENPSLTLVGITTPSTFFESVSQKDVLSGFLNRFVLHISDADFGVRKKTTKMDVPESIINWINAIQKRARDNGNTLPLASTEANPVVIDICDSAYEIQKEFELECVDMMRQLEKDGLEGLAGRANEMAMRISLICALSRDPQTKLVADVDMLWAVNYMRLSLEQLVKTVKKYMRQSEHDSDTMEVFEAIKRSGGGIAYSDMLRMGGIFRKMQTKQLQAILQSLVDSEMLEVITVKSPRGRPTFFYKAL